MSGSTPPYPSLAERVLDALDADRATQRVHVVLDALERAFGRHRGVHPDRQAGCEMCDLRGALAGNELLGWPTDNAPTPESAS